MIDLKNLINMLPYMYKSRDTYKVNDQGILERFINILGYYLNDEVLPEVDKALDNIDLDKVPEYYLNYFWELLGELPFGYAFLINKDLWDKYYESNQLESKKAIWEISKEGPIILSTPKIRELLKYSITLLKIRGTKKFYETLLKIYGLKCTITDIVNSTYKDDFNGVSYNPDGEIQFPKYDEDLFDESDYDIKYKNCQQCIPVSIDISTFSDSFNDKYEVPYADKLGILLYGKELSNIDIIKGVEDYTAKKDTEESRDVIKLKEVLEIFFDKYLPFNVTLSKLTIMNVEIDH